MGNFYWTTTNILIYLSLNELWIFIYWFPKSNNFQKQILIIRILNFRLIYCYLMTIDSRAIKKRYQIVSFLVIINLINLKKELKVVWLNIFLYFMKINFFEHSLTVMLYIYSLYNIPWKDSFQYLNYFYMLLY